MYNNLKEIIKEYNDGIYYDNLEDIIKSMQSRDVNFNDMIENKSIYQENVCRKVYWFPNNCYEEIIIKYLKKRLDDEMNIIYPHRTAIMKSMFEIVEALPKMSDFTLYKCDFKDFFNTISSTFTFEKFLSKTNLLRYKMEIIEKLVSRFEYCYAGIPTSNAFVEIIAREFDLEIKKVFSTKGMIFYSRYVDDIAMIFNRFIEKDVIAEMVSKTCDKVFHNMKIQLNSEKEKYINFSTGCFRELDYLGYTFMFNTQKKQFLYGIKDTKLKKYRKRFNNIFEEYKNNRDANLLKERYEYLTSRVVFYNNFDRLHRKNAKWDVFGLINNYSELRPFLHDTCRITSKTKYFLNKEIFELAHNIIGHYPYFINPSIDSKRNSFLLINRFASNKSIVFHPKIGWSYDLLYQKIHHLDPSASKKVSYNELVKIYCSIIKIEGVE